MPPRTRTRATKVSKENIDVVRKSKVKSAGKVAKPPRKALADKTNSLSDDNSSIDVPIKTSKKAFHTNNTKRIDDSERPKRERRIPPRFLQNQTLKNLSNGKDSLVTQNSVTSKPKTPTNEPLVKQLPATLLHDVNEQNTSPNEATNSVLPLKVQSKSEKEITESDKINKISDKQVPITNYVSRNDKLEIASRPRRNCRQAVVEESHSKASLNVSSPFKTPSKVLESSLVANRPKRVHRLPSKFDDHSISPSKFIPLQPNHASTPIPQKNKKSTSTIVKNANLNTKSNKSTEKSTSKHTPNAKPTKANSSASSIEKNSPDTNNNGKKVLRPKRATVKAKLQTKQVSPKGNKITHFAKRLLNKSLSFKVLEDKNCNNKDDVYEFTFDPNEEPIPKKKKRKRPVKKRPEKPKTVFQKPLKSNYNDNVSKALENLKTRVKPSQTKTVQSNIESKLNVVLPTLNNLKPIEKPKEKVQSTQIIAIPDTSDKAPQSIYNANITPTMPSMNESATSIHASNYASIRVEDIAADFELSDHQNDINYSPVNTPHHQPDNTSVIKGVTDRVQSNDPLNLQENVIFFEDPPVASSSMNMSVRHPLASPWRVEFGALPMKWHSNAYVKPNMTPAVESSFINSEQSTQNKHVYTNLLTDEPIPEIFDNPAPALKQTSIILFMKEVAERNANKRKRRRSPSPKKTLNTNFTDANTNKTPKKSKIAKDSTPNDSNSIKNTSKDKENSTDSSNKSLSPEKAQKKKDKDCTYFGFDESEDVDQENISPSNNIPNKRAGLRSGKALAELNAQSAPTRSVLPVHPKLTSSETVEKLYDQMKSAEQAQFPAKKAAKEPNNTEVTDINGPSWCDDDSQSVHLFEDIDVVHHVKPHRKSYGKAKKVNFQQTVESDSDSQPPVAADLVNSSDEDDLADLTFQMPNIKEKKPAKRKKPKKQLSKKEEKEAEEWAAGFNSMCEDIDEFPLLVE